MIRSLIASLAVLLLATQAQAFSVNLNVASAVIPSSGCTSCSVVRDEPTASTPFVALRIPSGGGFATMMQVVPLELTAWPMTVLLGLTDAAGSPDNGNVCSRVCAGVATPGEFLTDLDMTSCTSFISVGVGTVQYPELTNFLVGASIIPKLADGAGTACTGDGLTGNCARGSLYISVEREITGSCSGGSGDNADYKNLTVLFQ